MSVAAVAAKHPDLDWSDKAAVSKAMREFDEQQARELDQRREEEEREFAEQRAAREAEAKAAAPAEAAEVPAEGAEATPETPAEAAAVVTDAEKQVAELRAQMDALAAENAELAKQIGARAKTETAAQRQKMLEKLTAEYGDDHVLVEEAKLRYAEMDRLDAALEEAQATKAAAEQVQEQVSHQAEHEQVVKSTPFLKSIYDSLTVDGNGQAEFSSVEKEAQYAAMMRIGARLQAKNPNITTAAHYKLVEAEMLKAYPAAKAQFYGPKQVVGAGGKVVPISASDIPGGKTAVTGEKPKATQADLMRAVLNDPSKTSLQHARALGLA